MSKAVKSVVAVVAAVAIPFAAPAIASSIGMSAAVGTALGSATAGAVVSSAIVGAGLGAVSSAVTGGDVGRGALMGAIGGGIGGYTSAPATPTSAVSPQAMTAANASSDPIAALNASQGWTASAEVPANLAITTGGQVATQGATGWEVAGQAVPSETIAYGGQVDSALASQLSASGDSMAAANAIQQSGTLAANTPAAVGGNAGFLGTSTYTAPTVMAGGAPAYQQAGLAVSPAAEQAASIQAAFDPRSAQSVQAAAQQTTAPSAGTTAQVVKPANVIEAISARFTDPNQQADLLLRAAGQLTGSALAGEGLTPEQQQLVNQQADELQKLKDTNQDLFNEKLAWAQGLLGESRYFDPEYFGTQAQRGVQQKGARAKREAQRRALMQGKAGLATAEGRRADLAIATGGQTAYLQGADVAQQNKLRTMQAGLAQLPTGAPEYSKQYADLQKVYADAEKSRQTASADIGSLFGDWTGGTKARSAGLALG